MNQLFTLASKMEALASTMLDPNITMDETADRMVTFIVDELHLTEEEGAMMMQATLALAYLGMAQDELECALTLAYSKVLFERKKARASA